MFAVRLLPFIDYKTATTVAAKPFSHFRRKTKWQDESKGESFKSGSRLHTLYRTRN